MGFVMQSHIMFQRQILWGIVGNVQTSISPHFHQGGTLST